ncbi:UDP-N-acetylglucosamine--N-acetylmuramyl-(pentapeptide) pyrophosphoryl-undecaprenol N-acetylglucosamine transferase [Candidatus Mcinerneyibacteriota bacterium]|nr:UDP-N-acetylglucosamine--N-acetylmuramyl-(pentapeptide) pyrophosphoryl-undecaprenol N-acetylglucosamine transferase [Candidatus Mcinerneyibacteriota bacterium]
MKVLLAAGGTGGHIYPALALGQFLAGRGARVSFGGTNHRMERELFEREGADYRGFEIYRPGEKIGGFFKNPLTLFSISNWIRKEAFDCVVCAGGYVSFYFGLAAAFQRKPLYLLEQNVIPGRVTRLLAPLAEKVFVSFPESLSGFAPGKALWTGNPVRASLLKIIPEGEGLAVLGGSLGSRRLNEALVRLEKSGFLEKLGRPLLWITGERDFEMVSSALEERPGLRIFSYCHHMEEIFAETALAVSRAGATALAELEALEIPGILVPYPHAKDDHQRANARAMEKKGGYIMVEEGDGFEERLEEALIKMNKAGKTGGREPLHKNKSAAERIAEAML